MSDEDYSFPCGHFKMCRTHTDYCSGMITEQDGVYYISKGNRAGKQCAVTEQLTLLKKIVNKDLNQG